MDSNLSNYMINSKYKDRLFRFLFQDKKHLLSLYNAIRGTNYNNIDDLEITTIEDVIYMKMKNDLSFIIDSCMSVYEHQSTFNPNMPVRGLIYFGILYNKYIKTREINIYSSKLRKLPTPQYYVFYNGDKEFSDRTILKLSDAFEKTLEDGSYEWTAIMLNINYGYNQELLDHCRILQEYSYFIHSVKNCIMHENDTKKAIDTAVKQCIREGVLAEFLQEHRAEVIEMCLTEYDEQKVMAAFAREAEEDAAEARAKIEQAKKEAQAQIEQMQAEAEAKVEEAEAKFENTRLYDIKNIMEALAYTAEQAMDLLKIPVVERQRLLEKLG